MVEHKKLKLGRGTEVDRYRLIDRGIVLKALPAHSPKVSVIDAYLKPLAGAKVTVKVMYGLTAADAFTGVTNKAGEVTVPAVYHGGKYAFRAALPGYCPRETTPPAVGGKNWIDFVELVTEPGSSVVKGKVVDAKGNAVAGARVSTDFGPSALTDGTGKFTLKEMPSWTVRLDARKGSLRGTNVDAKGNLSAAREPVLVVR